MGIALGPNQYGKAENRVVRVYRDTDRHEIRDLNVSTSLRGDFRDAHITGDQADVLPTDTQKNTAFAFAKEKGISSPEQFGITLGAHFLDTAPKATASRIGIEEYAWERIEVDGHGHDHSFVRRGPEFRTTVVTTDDSAGERRVWVVSGVQDLVILKSTGSGFKGFLKDKYTTLQETEDRIMATSLTARWRYEHTNVDDWNKTYDDIKRDDARGVRQANTPKPCSRRFTRWARRCSRHDPRWPRSSSPHPTSTTSSSTCRRSAWRTTTRSSSPPTGPTA